MNATEVWLDHVNTLVYVGDETAPRGQATRELLQHTLRVNMRHPVVQVPERKLSYRFMAAEAFWILTGDDRVATIAPYNERIKEFSDNGQTFFGAYGPKITAQMDYVVAKLKADPDTRQAGLNIWRESPPMTKDVPCTVAMWFYIRQGRLQMSVFMRSSDAWLGVPYDIFNFSMVAHFVCGKLRSLGVNVSPGWLRLTMGSAHIYQPHWLPAQALPRYDVIRNQIGHAPTPEPLHQDPLALVDALRRLRDSKPGDEIRWWEAGHAS